ncbi:MAG: hypothetical protein IJG42_04800 [Muribaculaceae bacterium]|nr:hypothetical protein [Muribaculaceae bacterium]
MMKYLIHIWLIIMVLAGVLASCIRVPDYDRRLTSADSLMYTQFDTALARLTSIDPNSLNKSADRAYYSLLLTQARYMNYIPISGDSNAINASIEFFEHHNAEHEKLARAYLYNGARLEEDSKPDSAMLFYKKAEVTASENGDYFNKGYSLLRMSKLYTSHNALDGRDLEKLEQAVECFERVKDTTYQILCLKELGAQYRSRNADVAENKLKQAISLAEVKKDTGNLISCHNILAYLYFMQGQKDKFYNTMAYRQLQRIKPLGLYGLNDNVYTTFANVYASLGMPDSAMWYLQLAQQGRERDSTYFKSNNYLEPLSLIAKARGEELNFLKLSLECDSISFSSFNDPEIVNIMYAELSFDEQYKNQQDQARRTRNYIYWAIAAAVILSLLLLALLFYRRSHHYDKLVLELKDRSQSQNNDLADLQVNINELKINDERLKGFIASHMGMLSDIIEACYHEPNNRIAENMKRIVKFQDSNRDNWVKLYDYIDLEHDNIMTRTRENYPQLNDRELLLLALTCMGYSYIHIAIIMGYSNATSVSVIKQRLVKKMGLDCSLNEYIQNNGKV